MPPSDTSPAMTPLAPSVEKAYYRKCIQLKRRLNEVEAANDEARLKRVRLDRAIMKMRLERAFLLDELRRRMDVDIDGSDGSGDEGMATPPPDRPHRDKRRRHQQSAPASNAPSTHSVQSATLTPSAQRTTAEPNASTLTIPGPGNQAAEANPATEEGRYVHGDPAQPATQGRSPLPSQPPALSHESPHNQPQTAAANANATNGMDIDGPTGTRESGSTSKPTSTRPATVEENGDRAAAPSSTEDALSGDQEVGRSAFTAVNNH